MHDPLPVRGREPLAHLDHQIELALERGRVRTLQVVGERPAFEQLHGDERAPLVLARVEDRDDVGMQQARRRLSLAIEPGARLGIASRSAISTFSATARPMTSSCAE